MERSTVAPPLIRPPRQQPPSICGRIRCALTMGPEGQVPPMQRPPAYKATLALLKWWPYKGVTTLCSISHIRIEKPTSGSGRGHK